jgi:hypothetical protein
LTEFSVSTTWDWISLILLTISWIFSVFSLFKISSFNSYWRS